MNIKEKTYLLLDELHIPYAKVEHEPIPTMEALEDISDRLMCPIAKNLLLCNRQKTKFYLLLMPGDKKFKTKELSSQINSARLSFTDDDALKELLGIKPGSLSLLGLMNDKEHKVTLLIDEDVMKWEFIGMHPCDNTATLMIARDDIEKKFLPYTGHTITTVHLEGAE